MNKGSGLSIKNKIQCRLTTLQKFLPVLMVVIWVFFVNMTFSSSVQLLHSILYSILGTFGAIFANLSGAGGGVVFIPVFNYLGFSEAQSISTSFSIQCFGMTAGAITWSLHYRKEQLENKQWQAFLPIIVLTAIASIAGIWTAYSGVLTAPSSLVDLFSYFSIVLGLSLLAQILLFNNKSNTSIALTRIDHLVLVLIGYLGGLITAWLSVGVGELLVLYLIFRGFNVTMSVAAAVAVTAITVWSASFEHWWLNPQTVWQVAMFAGPGAIIGGILAKTLTAMISTRALKLVLACWILLMGILG